MPRGKMLPPGGSPKSGSPPNRRNLHRTPRHLHGQLRRMVRKLAHYTGDDFSGRDRQERHRRTLPQFPGLPHQHSPATVYEKENYPLRGRKGIRGSTRFHTTTSCRMYRCSMTYLVTDATVPPAGAQSGFPGEGHQACAYHQSKFYGRPSGQFYGEQAWLWMPDGLAESSDIELQYMHPRVKMPSTSPSRTNAAARSSPRSDSTPNGWASTGTRPAKVRLLSPEGVCQDVHGGMHSKSPSNPTP